jgi:hypothetical protein
MRSNPLSPPLGLRRDRLSRRIADKRDEVAALHANFAIY